MRSIHRKIKTARKLARKSFRKKRSKKYRCAGGKCRYKKITSKKYIGISRAKTKQRKILKNPPQKQGWVNPNGKFFPLIKIKNKVI